MLFQSLNIFPATNERESYIVKVVLEANAKSLLSFSVNELKWRNGTSGRFTPFRGRRTPSSIKEQ